MAKTIREHIRALIQAEIAAIIGGDEPETVVERSERPAVRVRGLVDDSTDDSEPEASRKVVRRRTRRSAPRTAYVVIDRETLNGADLPAGNTVEVAKAFMQLGKRGAEVTEAAVVKATGLKTKAVQSSIWFLRNHDAAGNRLDLTNKREAGRALVKSVEIANGDDE